MTQETFSIADLKDILAIRLVCKCGKCHASQSLDPDGNSIVPDMCTQCRETWMRQGDTTNMLIQTFLERLKAARELQDPRFSLQIVMPRTDR